jgi:hypothetical protein
MSLFRTLARLASVAAVAATFSGGAFAEEPAKIGFVYIGPTGDHGWTYSHDQGRKAVEAKFGDKVKTTFVENVPETADAERVFRDLASKGHKVIFATSFGYMNQMLKVAKAFPNTKFMHATGYKSARTWASTTCVPMKGLHARRGGRQDEQERQARRGRLDPDPRSDPQHQRLHPRRAQRESRRPPPSVIWVNSLV